MPTSPQRLTDLAGAAPKPEHITRARQLFAAAIETPGGLRVQTIHAFSERLLQRFPLEAGIPPGFSILDDRTGAELRRAATDEVLGLAAIHPDTPLGAALSTMIAYAVDEQFDAVLRESLAKRDWLAAMGRIGEDEIDELYRRLAGLAVDDDASSLTFAMVDVVSATQIESLRDIFRNGGSNEKEVAEHFNRVLTEKTIVVRATAMTAALMTKGGSPRKKVVTKATRDAHPHIESLYQTAQSKFEDLQRQLIALDLVAATRALICIADAVRQRYEQAKNQRAALDFDDLIRKAVDLVQPQANGLGGAEWVLFKLDGGIDHILVDEAQDTSPKQWSLIDALAREFFSGGSRDDILRTLFAVGDEKQSIYGFQGAAPEMFQKMGTVFAQSARLRQVVAGGACRSMFRSAPPSRCWQPSTAYSPMPNARRG